MSEKHSNALPHENENDPKQIHKTIPYKRLFNFHPHSHTHSHESSGALPQARSQGHTHAHGAVDPSILTTSKGLWVVKWSIVGLMITAILQIIVFFMSGSIALLADTIHNFGNISTAIPLSIAFTLESRKPSKCFSYGYGRVEDLAGVIIVLLILFSAVIGGYESVNRFLNPQPVEHLQAVAVAAIIGLLGNWIVAQFRMKVGMEIGSAALIADGYHARVDGFVSLAVLIGAAGIWLGYPIIDPLIGMLITITIFKIVLDFCKLVFTRLLDGVEPEVIDNVKTVAESVEDVCEVTDLRVRWIGHRLHAEINAAVALSLSVGDGHEIANAIRKKLLENFSYLSGTNVHIDPLTTSGECCHCGYEDPENRHEKHKHGLNACSQ